MTNIIVVFAKIEEAKSIKNILVKNGIRVTAVCTSGAQALGFADEFHYGMIISGYRLSDMICVELRNNLSADFDLHGRDDDAGSDATQKEEKRGPACAQCAGRSDY